MHFSGGSSTNVQETAICVRMFPGREGVVMTDRVPVYILLALLLLVGGCTHALPDGCNHRVYRRAVEKCLAPYGIDDGEITDIWSNWQGNRLYVSYLIYDVPRNKTGAYILDADKREVRSAKEEPFQPAETDDRGVWVDSEDRLRRIPRTSVPGEWSERGIDAMTGAFFVYVRETATVYVGELEGSAAVQAVRLPDDFFPGRIACRESRIYLFDTSGRGSTSPFGMGFFKDTICLQRTPAGLVYQSRYRTGGKVQFVDRTGRFAIVRDYGYFTEIRGNNLVDTQRMRRTPLGVFTGEVFTTYQGELRGYRYLGLGEAGDGKKGTGSIPAGDKRP